jgi:hypothetical protein
MPRYWQTTTFLWDISLSSVLLALLDPEFLRDMMEKWMQVNIYQCVGTEYLANAGVAVWYAANDYSMLRMAYNYLRYSGDFVWLDKTVGGKKVIDHLVEYATHWRKLDVKGHGLGDYGGAENLLECVQSYTHEVASLNAANAFNLRFVADLLKHRGDEEKAAQLQLEAEQILGRVQNLYVPGSGYWRCRQPDGTLVEVRHCYDLITILDTIPEELSIKQKKEMLQFFTEELQTPTWMRALSRKDEDAVSSVRPDHQWTGAYTAWPSLMLKGLYRLGEYVLASHWLNGLARTARQGPFGQAHMVEEAMEPEAEGARKAPSEFPYICDWACVSNGNYLEAIIEGIFGVEATLFDGINAVPHLADLDPTAELRGLHYQGKEYSVNAEGVVICDDLRA